MIRINDDDIGNISIRIFDTDFGYYSKFPVFITNFIELSLDRENINRDIIEQLFELKASNIIEERFTTWNLSIPYTLKDKNPLTSSIFNYLLIEREMNNTITFSLSTLSIDDISFKKWNLKWSALKTMKKLYNELKKDNIYQLEEYYFDGELESFYIVFHSDENAIIKETIKKVQKYISKVCDKILEDFNSLYWEIEFEKNEEVFSKRFILPLLRRMKFTDVHYNHGRREYGKDFTFSEINKFGQVINHAIQVKKGDVSGRANSQIDELIAQIEDAFTMPYYPINSKEPKYITSFFIVISRYFTENAKEKIMHKVDSKLGRLIGAVYFYDKEKMLELAEKYK